VAIAAEAFWDECGSEGKEEEQANEKHGSHTEKVRDVLNLNHSAPESTENKNERSFRIRAIAQNYRACVTAAGDAGHVEGSDHL
jgi:hypothetical protein